MVAEPLNDVQRKVLIVDDNADQGRPLALILRHSGYDANFVTSGEAALTKVDEEPVGLMIVDRIRLDPSLRTNSTSPGVPRGRLRMAPTRLSYVGSPPNCVASRATSSSEWKIAVVRP